MEDTHEKSLKRFTIDDVYAFLTEELRLRGEELAPDTDLHGDLDVDGDDFDLLAEAYAKRFGVDMSGYRWYFHHGEELTFNLGAFFFRPLNKRVKSIPVTPKMLLEYANKGMWSLEYPPHNLPKRRYDEIINVIFWLGSLVILVVFGLKQE